MFPLSESSLTYPLGPAQSKTGCDAGGPQRGNVSGDAKDIRYPHTESGNGQGHPDEKSLAIDEPGRS